LHACFETFDHDLFWLERGCDEGVFLKLDLAKFDRKDSDFIPGAVSECGIGAYKVNTAPISTADFSDLDKWPGRRGLRKGPHYNLEFALLSDGVPAADIYKVLDTEEGVLRAFKKLDTIKSQVVWWEAPAQTTELVASGDVTMAVAPSNRIVEAKGKKPNLRLVFVPGLIGIDNWVILKDSPNADLGYKFLKIATDPKLQALWTNIYPMGPSNADAAALIDDKIKGDLPAGPNIEGALNTSSVEAARFWADKSDELPRSGTPGRSSRMKPSCSVSMLHSI
jgi:putative spermidine/putrescine transport system substrate-binding protein